MSKRKGGGKNLGSKKKKGVQRGIAKKEESKGKTPLHKTKKRSVLEGMRVEGGKNQAVQS